MSRFLFSTFLVALSLSPPSATANPLPTAAPELDYTSLQNATRLLERGGCANPCGWSGQYCCGSDQSCFTDSNNQAQCTSKGAGASSGYWQFHTSTEIDTNLITKTVINSDWVGASAKATATGDSSCNTAKGESSCGSICCASDQYCKLDDQCAAIGVTTSPGVRATGTGVSESYSAPLRPTTGTLIVVTATESPTTTQPFESPVATGATAPITGHQSEDNGGGLSGGAIAGIVIGVIAGVILLAALLLFCCAKAAWDGLLALLGIGGKRRHVRDEYVEERYRHSAGGHSHADWYGGVGRPPSGPPPPRKSSGFGGLGGVLAGLGAVALALGLKRKHDARHEEKSEVSGYGSSYYYTDYTSESTSSDDRRSHGTRYTQSRH
ncbi:uncharacterized protein K452DRAFT_296609 [Aplosporella prunicola CBS 121167]|uniref:Mid2 domain-containing protein n=1 Tax=Aplosporella prunicola CBS 121167 TaxID=1176127 RepID=A0A6A6BHH7_9PEZI|nr:uncharacterized protein K452DRAFT_296609 [Aplosporella prunicola CBS 121167]KAF2143602.1 hypothetical protein K452DRAFT_296609 [Aplosporella prunicola CBS 121167]